jgi:CSLREA domain-containing protein
MKVRPGRLVSATLPRAGLRLAVAIVAAAGGLVAVAAGPAAGATVITVNSANDPGAGNCDASECTLREAIGRANSAQGATTIHFAIGSGPVTIAVGTNLPTLTKQVTIDGTTQPGYAGAPLVQISGTGSATTGLKLTASNSEIKGLAIGGFSDAQVQINGDGNTLSDSYLGTGRSGNAPASGGATATVFVSGSSSGTKLVHNVIGGGAVGVLMASSASNNQVSGNSIGVGADGASDVGSEGAGVAVVGSRGVEISANRIAFNRGLGIDLGNDGADANDPGDADSGPNGRQNSPTLTSAERTAGGIDVVGTLGSTPDGAFTIDVFASPACDQSGRGQGQFYVGSLSSATDGNGNASFEGVIAAGTQGSPPSGFTVYTATATQAVGGSIGKETSELSGCIDETRLFDPPSPPTGVAVGAGDGQAQIAWLTPTSDGGSPLDHYTVASSPASSSSPLTVPAGTNVANMPNLTNGVAYTFTVTATNEAALTSDPSDVSEAVTPLAGTAAPEAASADVGSGQTLSTGDDANAADPTNTTVFTPNAGTVTIGEGAMTGTPPPGADYIGQQIDIRAPDASASNPMVFSFVIDCSEFSLSTSADNCPADPGPSTASVQVRDGSYSPSSALVAQGGTVTWTWTGSRSHTVTDTLRLGPTGGPLFSSGLRSTGATYSYAFQAAGSYPYKSTASGDPRSMTGTVDVPVSVSPSSGTPDTAIQVTLATSALSGYRFDADYRYRAPGASTYGKWKSWVTTTAPSKTFVPSSFQGVGDYQFRSRLVNQSFGRQAGWSAAASVTITSGSSGGGGGQHLAAFSVFHETVGDGNIEIPDCTGPELTVQPEPSCVWSEVIRPDGDLEIVVYTEHNNRWRVG